MSAVLFHRLARQELLEASAWYAARSMQAHRRFREAVADAVARVGANPEAHGILVDHYRVARVRRFPYALIFETNDDG